MQRKSLGTAVRICNHKSHRFRGRHREAAAAAAGLVGAGPAEGTESSEAHEAATTTVVVEEVNRTGVHKTDTQEVADLLAEAGRAQINNLGVKVEKIKEEEITIITMIEGITEIPESVKIIEIIKGEMKVIKMMVIIAEIIIIIIVEAKTETTTEEVV